MKLAGTVILYNPELDVSKNIYTYLDQIEKLYVIDNSSTESVFIKEEFSNIKKVVYIPNLQNVGIATALNKALELAEIDGYDFLLTMDQDSYFESGSETIEQMLFRINQNENLAIISPIHHYPVGKNQQSKSLIPIDKIVVMTSGNIVRVKLIKSVGSYKDELFIDYVDHEICLRLNKLGFKVELFNDGKIVHSLGNVKGKKFLWKKVYPTNHSFIRHYYKTRNRLFVYKTYGKNFPSYIRIEKINFIKDVVKVILFEDDKLRKLKFIFFGFSDFKHNIFGECKKQ